MTALTGLKDSRPTQLEDTQIGISEKLFYGREPIGIEQVVRVHLRYIYMPFTIQPTNRD